MGVLNPCFDQDPKDPNLEPVNGPLFFSLHITSKKLKHFASPPLAGDIQIGMEDKKGQLEVEVIRARSLTQKPGSKSTPGKGRGLGQKISHPLH